MQDTPSATEAVAAGVPTARRALGWESIVFLALLALAVAAPSAGYPIFLMNVLCFALFACAFNLLVGYVGLLSFGHAMFFGFAAYIAGHLTKVGTIKLPYWVGKWEWLTIPLPPLTPELAIIAATAVAALLGLVAGAIAIRRQGIYFAMVTLALSQMVFFFCVQVPFTGGEDGIQAIPRRPFLGLIDTRSDLTLYYIVLAIVVIGFLVIYRTIHSPFGQVLKAIRENEPRAVSLGYRVDQYKLVAFVISAALSGLAGATKSIVFGIASLTDVAWQMSGEVVLMTLVGGMGTVFGPIVGAGLIVTIQNYAAFAMAKFAGFVTLLFGWLLGGYTAPVQDFITRLGEEALVIQGVIFVITVLLFRRGIVGELMAWFARRSASPPAGH